MEEVLSHGRASLVAERLRDRADRLEHEQANPFRVFAYRRAADTIAMLGTQFDEIVVREGAAGLTRLPGVGPRIAAAISRILGTGLTDEPSVAVILDVDAEYRRKAAARLLPRIAPRRFNRTRDARLPVLHTRRGEWAFTALFSNTALAHRLRRTRDWVVIYFHRDHEPERRRTVVTETRGPLEGRRAVRGRESELTVPATATTAHAS
jgi:hypothetical protein